MITLNELKIGKKAIITEMRGGRNLKHRLESLNLRPGKIIKKISSSPFRGPVVVEVSGCKIAIGRGMANNILLEVINENPSHGQS